MNASALAKSLVVWLAANVSPAVLASIASDVLGAGDGSILIEEGSLLISAVVHAVSEFYTEDTLHAEIAAAYTAADAAIYAAEVAKFGPKA